MSGTQDQVLLVSPLLIDHLEHVEDVWDPRTGVVSKSTFNYITCSMLTMSGTQDQVLLGESTFNQIT
jgi:hypothetical protein